MMEIKNITHDIFNDSLFGIRFKINNNGVSTYFFTPTLISDVLYIQNAKQYQVYLSKPFFLPVKTSKKGLFRDLLFVIPEILKVDECININWSFLKRKYWKHTAISMYESYLKGNKNPSDILLIREMYDKLYQFVSNIHSPLNIEYIDEVEQKILDEGYSFQCIIEITSNRSDEFVKLIQDIFAKYDLYNSLKIKEQESIHPFSIQPNNQILSKTEIESLFLKESTFIEPNISSVTNFKDMIKILPQIKSNKPPVDDSIIINLTKALKRVGVINKSELKNPIIQQGSRLITINTEIPKDKNFSDIEKKKKDIQVALGVSSLGVEQGDSPNTMKFSIPHDHSQIISLRELIEDNNFFNYSQNHELAFIVGVDEINNPIYLSLKELRHILVVGSQGSGKSVFVNQLLTTLLIMHSPDELNLVLIDPKHVELSQFKQFPHVEEVVTDINKSIHTLNNLIDEMESRYKLFTKNNVKDIWGYRQKTKKSLPYIITVIEEWADLHSVLGKDVEQLILRLGQKARASGIFLIIVTQRPSSKILSGDIKANIQSKFSFNLGNNTNYKTVFDKGIPFDLLGKGDGVFSVEGYHKEFQRFQSPIISLNQNEESIFYDKLAKLHPTNINQNEEVLNKLKRLIATTKETRVTVLREKLGVKTETVSSLMNQLASEGWLKRHENRSKGYELVIDDEELKKWI